MSLYNLNLKVYKGALIWYTMVVTEMIMIEKELKTQLDEAKLCPRESYNGVLVRLIKNGEGVD